MPKKRISKKSFGDEMKDEFRHEMKKEIKCNHDCHCGCRHHGHHGGFLGGLWFAGWLFTIGLLKLTFWKAVLAIVIWAYYLGSYAASIWH
jgi:hypothetical protein